MQRLCKLVLPNWLGSSYLLCTHFDKECIYLRAFIEDDTVLFCLISIVCFFIWFLFLGFLFCFWLMKTFNLHKTRHIQKNNRRYYSKRKEKGVTTSAVVGMFFPYRHVGIIWSRRRHACQHNSSFKIEWNTRRKTVKTKVSRIIHAYIISLPSYIFIKALNLL